MYAIRFQRGKLRHAVEDENVGELDPYRPAGTASAGQRGDEANRSAGIIEGFVHLGWPMTLAVPLGILESAVALTCLIPRTSVLGAILVTGYMGGAIATHWRVGDPFFIQILVGIAVWGGLYLREPRLRTLIPLKS